MTVPHVYEPDDEPQVHNPEVHMEDAFSSERHTLYNNWKSFTIDDIPSEKWPQRSQEFIAWGLSEIQSDSRLNTKDVILHFTSRITGTLKQIWTQLSDAFKKEALDNKTTEKQLS